MEVPEQYVGGIVELFAQRKGEMVDMQPSIEVSVGGQAGGRDSSSGVESARESRGPRALGGRGVQIPFSGVLGEREPSATAG